MTLALQLFAAGALFSLCLSAQIALELEPSLMERRQVNGVATADIRVILDTHNEFRGKVKPQAADMRQMYWNEGLAKAAQGWADTCPEGHDANYERRKAADIGAPVGQNYARSTSPEWKAVVTLWHSEEQYYDYENLKSKDPSQAVGHYTQVVWGESSLVGCGFKECSGSYLFICDYAYGNLMNTRPYKKGVPCSACPKNCVNGTLCDCPAGKICQNGGTIDLSTCGCSCSGGFTGDNCEVCPINEEPSYCLTSFTPKGCAKYSNVPDMCPVMCGNCPAK